MHCFPWAISMQHPSHVALSHHLYSKGDFSPSQPCADAGITEDVIACQPDGCSDGILHSKCTTAHIPPCQWVNTHKLASQCSSHDAACYLADWAAPAALHELWICFRYQVPIHKLPPHYGPHTSISRRYLQEENARLEPQVYSCTGYTGTVKLSMLQATLEEKSSKSKSHKAGQYRSYMR